MPNEWETIAIFVLLALMLGSFIWRRIPDEFTALAGFAIVVTTQILPLEASLRAIANPGIAAIAGMLVIGSSLEKAGAIALAKKAFERLPQAKPSYSILGMILVIALVSALLNNTAVVVLLAPVVISYGQHSKLPPGKLLMPLSFAAILGGSCTLIGTSTNLVVSAYGESLGHPPFTFFELSKVGLPLLAISSVYLAFVGQRMLPDNPTPPGLSKVHRIEHVNSKRIAIGFAILCGIVLFSAFELLPIAVSAPAGSLFLIAAKCISPRDALSSLNWRLLLLIASMLGVGAAFQSSGASTIAASSIEYSLSLSPFPEYNGLLTIAIVFVATSLLTEILTNNAAAITMAAIAASLSAQLDLNLKPLLIAIAVAASSSYSTPIGYQTNTYVAHLAGYRFTDFLRVGTPMNVIATIVAVPIIAYFWPLR
ncbi:SLC13 family permease [Pelagicoccus enzymogenes]|uniref:SLC13 family permease n=1 Tax=Pelagicoccus enzymogenes TaxID=2773457 RepID=UPI00280E912C|nr:SLC13 family permease [Pelagicoccus enzymogenes]MDQ8197360.1 SLC13 family permease [Pelagicoccus enzymogenes]